MKGTGETGFGAIFSSFFFGSSYTLVCGPKILDFNLIFLQKL
jgi:hypothetical protein